MSIELIEPAERSMLCPDAKGTHRVVYWEFLPPTGTFNRTCVAVHGLTRNGRDFDVVASRLAHAGWRVVALDVVGRGRSSWLKESALYGYPQYISDAVVLLARLNVPHIDLWLGTSMGGIIGMFLASMPDLQTVIKRMILVDIGAFIPKESLMRIKSYVGNDPRFTSRADAVAACKAMLATFGPHSDEQFELLIRHYIREHDGGEWRYHYDPSIAVPFKAAPDVDVPLWAIWDQIKCPVRVLRGSESDVLLASTAAEMKTRGPPTEVIEFGGVGHAPTLIAEDQLRAVMEFAQQQ